MKALPGDPVGILQTIIYIWLLKCVALLIRIHFFIFLYKITIISPHESHYQIPEKYPYRAYRDSRLFACSGGSDMHNGA